MRTYPVSTPLAFAIACCTSFAAGYSFHLEFGFERTAARQAVVEAQAFQRVAAAYSIVILNHGEFLELSKVTTLEELNTHRQKRKQSTVRAAEFFIRRAAALELQEEKRFAEPFAQEAARIKASVEATR
jgi:hypothetical protein